MKIKRWKKGFSLCLAIFLGGCAAAPLPVEHSEYVPSGYTLDFSEEFTKGIDEQLWSFEEGAWPYNEELECYTRENASVQEGCLVIEARREEMDGQEYTSARLTTEGKRDFLYGYLEVRAKVPVGKGTWSAVWMLPSDDAYGGYLKSGEIDILEHVGYQADRVYATLHTEENNSVTDNAITGRVKMDAGAFHVYGLLWEENSIRIFVDGEEALHYARPEEGGSATWPFDLPFHLILNLAVGGSWGGAEGVDESAFPQSMQVDYVRYYTLQK